MGLFTIKQLPENHPDALITLPDRPGFHSPKKPTRDSQQLLIPYRPHQLHHRRRELRALDMKLSPAQREKMYLTEARAPRDSYVDANGRLIRTESRSPSTSTKEKRLSLTLSSTTSPRSPRSPRPTVVVQERSPRIVAEDSYTRLPDFHPSHLPQPDPYPVFIHTPPVEHAFSESEDSWSSDDSDERPRSDQGGVRYKVHRPRHRARETVPPPPPEMPEAPQVILNSHDKRRKRHLRRTGHEHREPTTEFEHLEIDVRSDSEFDPDDRPRRSRSHREGRQRGPYHHHSHHRHRSHHRHHSRHRSSGSRHEREERYGHRGRDFLGVEPQAPRPRANTGPSFSASPRPEHKRLRSWTSSREYVSRDVSRVSERRKSADLSEVKMLEDPQEVRKRELVVEREILGTDGRKVRQYHYR